MVGVELRSDYSASDLRGLARKSHNAKQALRLIALAGIADGLGRRDAAALGLMDRQTVLSQILEAVRIHLWSAHSYPASAIN